MVVAVLAIMVAAGAFVPVIPEWPEQRPQVLSDAGVVMMVPGTPETKPIVPAAMVDLDAWSYAAKPTRPPAVHIEPERLAYVSSRRGRRGNPRVP